MRHTAVPYFDLRAQLPSSPRLSDARLHAVEMKDRFLERRDRIIGHFSGGDRDGFLKKLREAEFAILALDADRGIRVLEELYRSDRENVELGFYLAETFFSATARQSGDSILISAAASMPLDPGMTTSSSTTSGLSSRASRTACFPSPASPITSKPSCSRRALNPWRTI